MSQKKILFIFSLLFIVLSFVSVRADEISSGYKNKFILGARANFMLTSTEYDSDEYNISNNVDLADGGVGFGLKAAYRLYIDANQPSSSFLDFEIFKDFGSIKSSDVKPYGSYKFEIEPSFGAKINIGYEFVKKHALFVSVGLQNFDYKFNYEYDWGYALETHKKEDNGWGYVLGVGYEYNITDYVSLSLALDYSVFDFEAPDVDVIFGSKKAIDMENTTVQFRTGLNFRF